MGSGEDDNKPKKQTLFQHGQTKFKLKMLALVILTNLLTIYFFTSPSSFNFHHFNKLTQNLPPLWDHDSTSSLSLQLNSTQLELISARSQLAHLQQKLTSTDTLIDKLLTELTQLRKLTTQTNQPTDSGTTDYSMMPEEVKLAVAPHKLPLGKAPTTGTDDILPPVGGGCFKYLDELSHFMSYKVGGECPTDDIFAQRFMLKGCEPLPRRRCHPKSPIGYVEPTPLPDSLWVTPPDTSIVWDPYTCKDYNCLVNRRKAPGIFDCKDCFELDGREKTRWLTDGGIDYGMDQVLSAKPKGTIRIGLDIGGGSGTFAVRMKERGVTIITTSMNFDGPFNSFISSRGLISMHVSVSQRLPFFENTLDIVHSMHVLSNWIPDVMLEFTLYDIYRVLRPGGLFWLDHFFCVGSQLNETYVPMVDRVGFNTLRWNAGRKLDRGVEKNEWYFSALLEKPMT